MKITDLYCEKCGKYVAYERRSWWMSNYVDVIVKDYNASAYKRDGKTFWLCYDCQKEDRHGKH